MVPPAGRFPVLVLLLLLLLATSTTVWKKDEFRSYNQTPFCKRARSRLPHSLPALSASSVSLSDGRVTALLTAVKSGSVGIASIAADNDSSSDGGSDPPPPPRPPPLSICIYQGGILRVHIDEDYPDSTIRRRLQVPDVVLLDLDHRHLWIPRLTSGPGPDSSFYLADAYEAVIAHDPFEIYVRRTGTDERVLSLNSSGLFKFEQLWEKLDGED